MTEELVRDPDSMVFLQLGEILRRQGQVDAARRIARTGLERHPTLADAHDLYARVLVDANELEPAERSWQATLQLDPRHQGAHKGLGFLYYQLGNLETALDHMELAVAADPTNQSVVQALTVVRRAAEAAEASGAGTESFGGFDGGDQGILLADLQGRTLGGALGSLGPSEADQLAAHLTGVTQEIQRTARMLDLGKWSWLIVEAAGGNVHLSQPTDETLLIVLRDADIPAGRLTLIADDATGAARQWLEHRG